MLNIRQKNTTVLRLPNVSRLRHAGNKKTAISGVFCWFLTSRQKRLKPALDMHLTLTHALSHNRPKPTPYQRLTVRFLYVLR